MRCSDVKASIHEKPITLTITSNKKPEISDAIMSKWQEIVDIMAITINIPIALIKHIKNEEVEVFITNKNGENPYDNGDSNGLLSELYCETIVRNKQKFIKKDLEFEEFKIENSNKTLKREFDFAVPIKWPDGEVFGIICAIGNKESFTNKNNYKLIKMLKERLEIDLEVLVEKETLQKEMKERRNIEEDLINLRNTIEENNKLICENMEYENIRKEFFSNISHELRTPINVILSAIQLIEVTNIPGKSQNKFVGKYLDTMKRNCYRLMRTFNNIIEVTKVDTDYYDINLQNIDIVDIVREVTEEVEEYIKDTEVKVVFNSKLKEKIIAADPEKIENIILNILSNAVKFTKSGGGGKITVNVFENGESVFISVEDTGIGIPEDKLDMIFEKFTQVNKSLTRNHEGSGMGLALVKSLVDKHNGKITVKSSLGVGSEFIIELPIRNICDEVAVEALNYNTYGNLYEKIKIEFSDIYGI
ncbi:sensor histidine kinase [Clostridium sp. 'White wine YQ']|uniref:sensor histidine kinase n=1 Tax=Clostridium sp. 'White wine YQ' TaxID=3027474 RepID=UPI002365A066|nr:HAMP domain-containing sensor histidine kinase [Clostridium sp. 'White wine YQ']MDD7794192.1 HAMP domain-containing sensor histidine kinase [Clostridium sp. 'White wine YQ']